MLRNVIEFSIRFRGVVIALALVVGAYGLFVAAHARIDVFPEFAPPQVAVQTEAPGLSPEEVERLVTLPIETAVNGVTDLETIRSQSIQGLSVVTAVFRDGTDVLRARQQVGERLAEAARRMPEGVHAPAMAPLTSATSLVLVVGLRSGRRTPMELRGFADWTLRPRLLGVPGVSKVAIFGGEVRQLQVQVLPDRLAAYGLDLSDVVEAVRAGTGVQGAGFVETAAQRIVLRTEGQRTTPELLGQAVIVQRGAARVRLADVARVAEGAEPKVGDAAIGGRPGVVLVVSSQAGANTRDVTLAVEVALKELAPAFAGEGIDMTPDLFRPATFIERAIANVNASLLLGGILVAAVLFVFLFNLRTAFISLTAIPLSLLAAVIVLDRLGVTLNTLTLGGLAIALGEVVDDAIIDVENIFRRLRAWREGAAQAGASGVPGAGGPAAARASSAFRVVLDASLEVRSAVVYATFVVALVFLPVLTMSGIQGKLFAPLGAAYVLAVLASLAVALVVTPALSYALLVGAPLRREETAFVRGVKERYSRILRGLLGRPRAVLAACGTLCGAALAALPFFGGAFLPELREGHFIVHMAAVPGTSLSESLRLGACVTRDLLRNPHLRAVSQQAGRAEQADDTFGPHYSEFHVDLVPLAGEEAELVQSEIRATLAKFPGVYFAIKPFLTERIEETMSGMTADVVVRIFGDDLDALDGKAQEVAAVLGGIEGAADVQVESPPGAPEMAVRLRPEGLLRLGFRTVDLLEAVRTAYQGTLAAQVYEGNRVTDVAVLLDPARRLEPERVGELLVRNRTGMRAPLGELAETYATTGRYAIAHDGTRRRQAVTCDVRGRDLASFVAEARAKVGALSFPPQTYPVFAGAAEERERAQREVLVHSLLAGAGVVLLLAVAFGRARSLLLVLANLPFALVGGVLAVFFGGGWLSMGSLVGFVTLFGITTRNSIMLISHYEHVTAAEGAVWGVEAAVRGAAERFLPILMTALVTGLGLLPMALGSGEPGREIEGPMAIVILGGLATSTALNLLVLPTLALRYGRFGAAAQAETEGQGARG